MSTTQNTASVIVDALTHDPGLLEVVKSALSDPKGMLAAVFAAVLGILGLRRKLSSDNAAIEKETAETDVLLFLKQERDSAMRAAKKAWDQRTMDAAKIATLESELEAQRTANAALTRQVITLQREMKAMRSLLVTIAPDRATEILRTGFGEIN